MELKNKVMQEDTVKTKEIETVKSSTSESPFKNKIVRIKRNRGKKALHYNRMKLLPATKTLYPIKNRNGDYLLGLNKEQLKQFVNLKPVIFDKDRDVWVYNSEFLNNFKITLNDDVTLDLSKERDNLIYHMIIASNYSGLALNPSNLDDLDSDILYYVLDEEKMTEVGSANRTLKLKATDIYKTMPSSLMIKGLAMYNLPTKDVSLSVAQYQMWELLEKDSKKFVDFFSKENSEGTAMVILFRRALEFGYIRRDQSAGKYYIQMADVPKQMLDTSEIECIMKLNDKSFEGTKMNLIKALE